MPAPKSSILFRVKLTKFLPVILLFAFLAVGSTLFSVQSQSNENRNGQLITEVLASPSPTPTPHTLVGSFYTTENNTDAKLLLNNKGTTVLEVSPTLYNLEGQEMQLPPVWVEPQNFRFIDLRDWAAMGGDSFKSGSIKLFHVGKDLVLGAQIYLTYEQYSLTYEEKFAEIGKFDSTRQEAVWQVPTNKSVTAIAFSNTSNAPLTVTGRLAKSSNQVGAVNTFQLAAHETRVMDLRSGFSDGKQFTGSGMVGLSLTHNGASKDALLARAAVTDPSLGFSNVVQFSNPAGGQSNEYQGVGFQIEDIGNQQLTPVIVARNVGTTTTTINAQVPYTRIDGTRGTIVLPSRQLTAGAIGSLDTSLIVQRVQQEQIKVASLEVSYTSAAGSLIVAAHTVSSDRNLVFRVPMWDPLAQRSPTGGYPWQIEGTSVTETYIKNITDFEEDYVAFLVWENGGIYMIGIKSLAAHETVHIDVKKLRDEQIPDERGRAIPLSVSSGQLQWTLRRKDNLPEDDMRANLSLMGRSEQVDVVEKIVNNYACQNCCTGNFVSGHLEAAVVSQTYDPLKAGDSRTYFAVEESVTCYNYYYESTDTNAVYNATWSSSSNTTATVTGGYVTGVNAGNVQISATWQAQNSYVYPCSGGGGTLRPGETEDEECKKEETILELEQTNEQKEQTDKGEEPVANRLPPCGSCVSRHFNFTAAVNIQIVVGVQKIQYQEPGNSNYSDAANPLFVLKGTSVAFKAIPDPANATFPSGQPTWSGTSGATGTGQTNSVTFNTTSSSTTDYKTVVASTNSGTPVTVNVVVYELTGTLTPQDNFANRSQERYGVAEKVNLSFSSNPSVTAQEIGGISWRVTSGLGTIPQNTNGNAVYTSASVSSTENIKLEVVSGPSKGNGVSYTKSIVAPTGATARQTPGTGVGHAQGYCDVAFSLQPFLLPKDVSFSEIAFFEGEVAAVATGYFASSNGEIHPMTPLFPVANCNIVTGCMADFTDLVALVEGPAPCTAGDFVWDIPWKYVVGSGAPHQFFTATHHMFTSRPNPLTQGQATIEKAGVGPFTKQVEALDSSVF